MAAVEPEDTQTLEVDIESISVVERPLEEKLDYEDGKELHTKILDKLIARRDYSVEHCEERYEEWDRVRKHLKLYIDLKAKARLGDKTSDESAREMPFQRSVAIPVSYANLHVLLTQMSSIFTARNPMIQLSGRGPEDVFRAKMMEVLLAYDNQQTKAFSALYSMFQDALAFGTGITYDSWEIESGAKFEYQPLAVPGVPAELLTAYLGPLAYTPIRTIGVRREYNRWKPVDPYKFRPDPRVAFWNLQDGEFCGHAYEVGYNALKKKEAPFGPYFNLSHIPKFAKNMDSRHEKRGTDGMNESSFNLMSRDEKDRGYFAAETMVVELIPKDWGISDDDFPMKYVFTWIDDEVIIRAHELPNVHQQFPYSVAESDPDFHSTWSPGIIELIEPMQRYINWLFNSHIENITSVLNNQWVYSPRFIERNDLEYGGPGEHIRLKNEAVEMMLSGEIADVRQFFFQVPIQDVTGPSYMNAVQYLYQMVQLLSGANDPMSGIQLPTERSATEIHTITAKASDRLAILAKLSDENAIQPLIQRSILNRQQFTQMAQYYRILGEFAQEYGMDSIFVEMQDLQGEFDYIPISGIMPEDPARSAQAWSQIMASAAQNPALQQPGPDGRQLDFRKVFDTIAQKMGITNIGRYYMDVQVVPDEEAMAQEQAGNFLPVQAPGNAMLPAGG